MTQVIAYDDSDAQGLSGQWVENVGGFDDWERVRNERAARANGLNHLQKNTANATLKPATAGNEPKPTKQKLSFKDQRELEALPDQIAKLEAEQAALTAQLADPSLYTAKPQEAARLSARLSEIDDGLLALLERWEALEALSNPAGR